MLLKGFAVSGALLSLLGAACGLGGGAFYIKKNWVDCEGFDFFSAMAGNEGKHEEREHLDREAASLVNDVYRTKLGPANGSTVKPKPMLAFALQPAMADIGDFESLFGGLDNAPCSRTSSGLPTRPNRGSSRWKLRRRIDASMTPLNCYSRFAN